MNVQISRERLERFGRLVAEHKRREQKRLQSQRGWYDEDGVRQGGLMAFIRYYWHVLEPEAELVEGWALYAIVEHLEAVTFGEILRLLITVPPGFMKSLCTDVFWPAWNWGPMNKAHQRYVAFSYSASLTERDNERFRDLLIHESYQVLWHKQVKVVKIGATKVTNTRKGWKLASSVGGVGTGERGDVIVLDDAHNIKEAESEIIRNETIRWFRESMSDRLNNLQTGAIVIIMQRSHEDDVAGCILELGLPYCHLMVPMEYEYDRQFADDGTVKVNAIGWLDPRFVEEDPNCDGELAWPDRFPPHEVGEIRTIKGPYAYAGQYQQSPSPRGGGIFQRSWWQLWEPPDGKFPVFELLIASLDSAFTENTQNDPSGLTVWGIFLNEEHQRRIMLVHAWRKHLQFSGPRIPQGPKETPQAYKRRTHESWGLMEWVQDTCNRFKVDKLLIEAKASGISAAQELQNRFGLQDWSVQLCPVKGDKVARALACQPTFSQMMVYAPAREWAEEVITEMATFPKGKYDDLTDSATQAIKYLRGVGLAQTDEESRAAELAQLMHKPKQRAIYPV